MRKIRFILTGITVVLALNQTVARGAAEQVPGETFKRTAKGETGVTYHVKIPENYRAGELRPVLVVFSPAGNGSMILRKMQEGAGTAGWIVVGCDSLRNNFRDHNLAKRMEDEILEDVYRNLPVNRDRVYLGGFSGGGWRAYHISARRKEQFAGILSYGGWLGGYQSQDAPYCANMSVAMINGVRDRGANAWVAIDTETLKKRNCSVKHFSFDGGHKVAPPDVTEAVVDWMEEEWKRKVAGIKDTTIPLNILYVGENQRRTGEFKSFLSKHFRSATVTAPGSLTTELVNGADVLVMDSEVKTLLDGCSKAMILMGPSSAQTARFYGSKIGSLFTGGVSEQFLVSGSHPLYTGPSPVSRGDWRIEKEPGVPGLLAPWERFTGSDDSEILAGGTGKSGQNGVVLLREAHRLFWGFGGSPEALTEEGKKIFVNAIAWIHRFDGHQQTTFNGLLERDEISGILEDPTVSDEVLSGWFPQRLLDSFGYNRVNLLDYYNERLGYVYIPHGSGMVSIDREAEALGTPNNIPSSMEEWISMLGGEQKKLAQSLLLRYSGERIRGRNNWKQWFSENGSAVIFSDEKGYRFFNLEEESVELISGHIPFRFRPADGWYAVDSINAVSGKNEFIVFGDSGGTGKMIINGTIKNRSPYLFTRSEYRDLEVHLEFMVPKGSNAGVYLMGRYEIQILDSYGVEDPKFSDLGGVYQRWDRSREGSPGYEGIGPLVNAAKAPGEWQTLDIVFRAPRFDEGGNKTENARFISVHVNGKLVQQDVDVTGPTRAHPLPGEAPIGPVAIQGDHGPVAIRSYTVQPLDL